MIIDRAKMKYLEINLPQYWYHILHHILHWYYPVNEARPLLLESNNYPPEILHDPACFQYM